MEAEPTSKFTCGMTMIQSKKVAISRFWLTANRTISGISSSDFFYRSDTRNGIIPLGLRPCISNSSLASILQVIFQCPSIFLPTLRSKFFRASPFPLTIYSIIPVFLIPLFSCCPGAIYTPTSLKMAVFFTYPSKSI